MIFCNLAAVPGQLTAQAATPWQETLPAGAIALGVLRTKDDDKRFLFQW